MTTQEIMEKLADMDIKLDLIMILIGFNRDDIAQTVADYKYMSRNGFKKQMEERNNAG